MICIVTALNMDILYQINGPSGKAVKKIETLPEIWYHFVEVVKESGYEKG